MTTAFLNKLNVLHSKFYIHLFYNLVLIVPSLVFFYSITFLNWGSFDEMSAMIGWLVFLGSLILFSFIFITHLLVLLILKVYEIELLSCLKITKCDVLNVIKLSIVLTILSHVLIT
jgi:hypothetical protein